MSVVVESPSWRRLGAGILGVQTEKPLTADETNSVLRSVSAAMALIGGSLLLRLVYVFFFTKYTEYVVSDMGGYWVRASERYIGDEYNQNQYALWPTLYHILLCASFHVYDALGIEQDRWLACTLVAQMVAVSVSVYFLYELARIVLHNDRRAFALATLYSISYPIVFFNTMIMSEDLAIPLLIVATFLVVRFPRGIAPLIIAGALLGVAAGVRPACILPGLLCFAYLLATQPGWQKARSIALLAAFSGVILGVCHENARISQGHLTGLSANGGLNFFIAQKKVIEVDTAYELDGGHYMYGIGAAQFGYEAGHGAYHTDQPFFNQGYFFSLGLAELKNPETWIADFKELRKVFYGNLFPKWYTCAGFAQLDRFFKWFCGTAMIIAIFAPPIVWALRRKSFSWNVALCWSFLIATMVQSYFFGCERRYSYGVLFATYLIVFWLLPKRQGKSDAGTPNTAEKIAKPASSTRVAAGRS